MEFVTSTRVNDRVADALQSPTLAFGAALLLRMGLLWAIHRERDAHQFLFFPTSHETWNVAWSMATGQGFSSPLAGMHGPTAWVAPVYPWLLAMCLKLSSNDPYSGTVLCLSLNCLASALTCWPIYGIAARIGSREMALASCWLWVFLPTAVIFPLEWLWDPSLSALFVATLIYWTLSLSQSSSLLQWAGYGALWGIAVLTNPAVGILLPFAFLWLLWHHGTNHSLTLLQPVAMLVLFVLCLLPWTIRNYTAMGRLVPIKDNFGLEFWLGNNSSVKRDWSPDHHPVGDPHEMQQLLQMGEADYMRMKQRQAIEFVRAHPRAFLKLVFDRFVDTWTGLGDVPSDRWVSALHTGTPYIWFTSVFSLCALFGLYLAWRWSGWEAAPIWLAPLVLPVTYYLTHSILRYRHPVDPVLTVLAVCALARARSLVWRRIPAHTPSETLQAN
jgi:4-amino-4-deoxy-L-arabinose transferase-like glycosyltransferase